MTSSTNVFRRTLGVLLIACFISWLPASRLDGAQHGIVAKYSFDEGAGTVVRDGSGNGHNGIIHGAKYVDLQEGSALEFDGSDDYVEIPAAAALRLSKALTVEAWVNPKVSSTGAVVSKNGCSTLRQNYLLAFDESGVLFELVEDPDLGKPVGSRRIENDKWHHITGTFDGATRKIYVDGELHGTVDGTFVPGTLDCPLYIGAMVYGGSLGHHFFGQIDDVRVYNRALSGDEIQSNYRATKSHRISKLSVLLAEVTPFEQADTTPPTLNLAFPPPDSTATGAATISASFADKGSGINISSAKVVLDGENVTDQAKVTVDGFSISPARPLATGIHQVEVTVQDRAGNLGNRLRWRFGVDVPVPVEVKFDGDVFRVSGEPYFPLGIYEGNSAPFKKLQYLGQAGAAGINYRLEGSLGTEALDVLLKHGMKAMVREGLAVKDHPALLGWWAEYGGEAQKNMAVQEYQFIKERDPYHPVIYMHTWAGRISDGYFVYAYPILNRLAPGDRIINLNGTLKSAFESARAEGKGKHVWFCGQAFDYRLDDNRGKNVTLHGGFRPTRKEIRVMNYLALAKGVKGLLYYAPAPEIAGTDYVDSVTIYPRQWTECLNIASEVRHLTPVLATGKYVQTTRLQEDNPAIHYRELIHDGVHTLIAVNVERELVLGKWTFDQPTQPQVLFEDRVLSEQAIGMTDLFNPLEVHIYQWK